MSIQQKLPFVQQFFLVVMSIVLVVGSGFGVHALRSLDVAHHAPASVAAQGGASMNHGNTSCNTSCTLARPTKLEKLKKAIKRLRRKIFADALTVQALAYISSNVHSVSTAPKKYILRPPPCKLFACYIS